AGPGPPPARPPASSFFPPPPSPSPTPPAAPSRTNSRVSVAPCPRAPPLINATFPASLSMACPPLSEVGQTLARPPSMVKHARLVGDLGTTEPRQDDDAKYEHGQERVGSAPGPFLLAIRQRAACWKGVYRAARGSSGCDGSPLHIAL